MSWVIEKPIIAFLSSPFDEKNSVVFYLYPFNSYKIAHVTRIDVKKLKVTRINIFQLGSRCTLFTALNYPTLCIFKCL